MTTLLAAQFLEQQPPSNRIIDEISHPTEIFHVWSLPCKPISSNGHQCEWYIYPYSQFHDHSAHVNMCVWTIVPIAPTWLTVTQASLTRVGGSKLRHPNDEVNEPDNRRVDFPHLTYGNFQQGSRACCWSWNKGFLLHWPDGYWALCLTASKSHIHNDMCRCKSWFLLWPRDWVPVYNDEDN